MYDCLSKEDEDDEEMEPAPTARDDIIGEIIVKVRNEEKQERNEIKRRARVGRRRKRKERQVLKEAKEVIKETKETLRDVRTTQPRRSPRLNPTETAGSAYESMNLGADMHSAGEVTEPKQKQPRQPYELLTQRRAPPIYKRGASS